MAEHDVEEVWLPVIGRALAHICMHNAGLDKGTIVDRASFLVGLGIDVDSVAEMLGSSPASVRELLRVAKGKKRGPKKNAAKKSR